MQSSIRHVVPQLLLLGQLLTGWLPAVGQTVAMARQPAKPQPNFSALTVRRLSDVLNDLKARYQTDILFEDRTVIELTVPADILAGSTTLTQSLDRLLKPFQLRYRQVKAGTWIILNRKEEHSPKPTGNDGRLPGSSTVDTPAAQPADKTDALANTTLKPASILPDHPQDLTVRGRVTDVESKEGLPGVSVVVKGTNRGTSTDATGNFQIAVPDPSTTLVFSFVGYDGQEVSVGNQTALNIALRSAPGSLAEVVVVGYGQQKRANLTGAVATVENKEIVQNPVADLSNSLAGRLPGLITKQTTGEPGGDGAQLYIRGIGTPGNAEPLYVIDGIPRTARDFTQLNGNEIASVTILKDAASAAVFGARSGNGVVLVTTRRGKAGTTSFNYSLNYGIQQPTRLPTYLDSYNYATLYNEGLRNEGKPELYTADDLQKFKDGSDPDGHPNTDWLKTVLKPSAPLVQHNLSVSGGSDKIRYFASLSYLDQKGLYENSGYKRYNLRSNIDAEITKSTHLVLDLGGRVENRTQSAFGTENIFYLSTRNPPTTIARYQNGQLGPGLLARNPAAYNESGYDRTNANVILTRLSLVQDIPFVPGLSVKGVAAVDKVFTFGKRFDTPVTLYDRRADGTYAPLGGGNPSLSQTALQSQSVTLEAHVNYARTFGRHTLGALGLYTQNRSDANEIYAYRKNFASGTVDQFVAGDLQDNIARGTASVATRQGYVGRVNYEYDSRYLFEANFRYDGSANFPPGRRWGFFPSFSAGWILSEERFIKNRVSFLDFLKVRASWGKLGNDRVNPYQYVQSFGYGSGYTFGTTPVVAQSIFLGGVPDPNITWEKVAKTNGGVEARFLKGLIGLEADYFFDHRTDILRPQDKLIPDTFGSALPDQNSATVDNHGIELALTHQHRLGNEFKYFVRGNFTFVRSKVISFNEPASVLDNVRQTGRPLNTFFGLRALGLFQTEEEIKKSPKQLGNVKPGDIRYEDRNGDGKVDFEDRTQTGKSNIPEIIYGLSAGFSFRGIDFSMLWQGAGSVNQYLETIQWAFYSSGKVTNQHLDRWTPTNPNATYPRLESSISDKNTQVSSYWLTDASYLRLKNLELGYSLPKGIARTLRTQHIRLYVNGANLLTFSKIKQVDPESASVRGIPYPQQKIYNAGINFQF